MKKFDLAVVFALAVLAVLVLSLLYPSQREAKAPTYQPFKGRAVACHARDHLEYFTHCIERKI